MKILMAHNFYQQPGGEDQSFLSEAALLEEAGHQVVRFTCHNDDVADRSRVGLAVDTVWSRQSAQRLRAVLRTGSIDIAHFQNTFPLISPSAYYAARREGVPVVQSLRNYRLLCPNALFYRDGHVCEDCLPKAVPWPGVVHRCYRGSLGASAVTAAMLTAHRMMSTWTEAVDVYIASTEFSRQKFIEGGLPADRIALKPNFVLPDPGMGSGGGGFALYVGRLSAEKGIGTLLAAWELVGARLPLKVVGDGPLAAQVREQGMRGKAVEWLGQKTPGEVYQLMGQAVTLIFPSEWYETFGRTIAEAFANGTPVIASRLGGMTSMVEHGRTGLQFRAGDPADLAAQVEHLMRDPERLRDMRRAARAEFEARYTAERNYTLLMAAYGMARERRHARTA
jgi:glycosyltransferase involved in cell wall biosynthesis